MQVPIAAKEVLAFNNSIAQDMTLSQFQEMLSNDCQKAVENKG
jgi:hypothetical protein